MPFVKELGFQMTTSFDIAKLNFVGLVLVQVEILNSIFAEVGAAGIFENPDITFDPHWCNEWYLKFHLSRPDTNSVSLDFHLMADGLRIDFESYPEAHEYSEKHIKECQDEIKNTLFRLLTGFILVEYKGNAQFVNLFNDDGSQYGIWSLGSFCTLVTHGYWKSQSIDQHLFEPIYSRSNS